MKDLTLLSDIQRDNLGVLLNGGNTFAANTIEWKRFLFLVAESLMIYGTFRLFLSFYLHPVEFFYVSYPLVGLILLLIGWVFVFLPGKSYLPRTFSFATIGLPLLLHASVGILIISLLRVPVSYYPFLLQHYLGICILFILFRNVYQVTYQKRLQPPAGKFVIVSMESYNQGLVSRITAKWGKSLFAGTFERVVHQDTDFSVEFERFKAYCFEHQVQYIFINLPAYTQGYSEIIAQFAAQSFIRCLIVPAVGSIQPVQESVYSIGEAIVYDRWIHPLEKLWNTTAKRVFDIVFSVLVMVFIFSWLVPIIAIAIKLSSPGPVFFVQHRPGKRNRPFKCFKFRTMRINGQSEKQATFRDPRVTSVGQFLRKTSLDELPQFYNVLLGDMSIVGPRPNMMSQLEYYSKLIPEYPMRHAVAPGITGYAQVKGFRGETKQLYLMQKRVDFDLVYIKKWNFWFDIRIIFLTVRNMLAGEKYAY